jgi:hypothetical protein
LVQASQIGVKTKFSPKNSVDAKTGLRLNLNQMQNMSPSIEANHANTSIENTSMGLNETFLNSKRLNQTTFGEASQLQNLDNSLFSDLGTGRSLNT